MTYMYDTPDPSIHGVLFPDLDEDLEFDFGVFFMDGDDSRPPEILRHRPQLPEWPDYGHGIFMVGKLPRGRDERHDPPCEAQRRADELVCRVGSPALAQRKPLAAPPYREHGPGDEEGAESEEEQEFASHYLLSRAPGRQVHLTCHRGRWVIHKQGRYVSANEAVALHHAGLQGLPVPRVLRGERLYAALEGDDETRDGGAIYSIKMSYIAGQPLTRCWDTLTHEERVDVVGQVRDMLLRLVVPPSAGGGAELRIGNCDGDGLRDSHVTHTHFGPACGDERAFNRYLVTTIAGAPPAVRRDYARRLGRRRHRVVFCHCDLSPDNIVVDERMRVVGLLDWEDAGYYPEHWESIKFYARPEMVPGWHGYGRYLLPGMFEEEVQDFLAVQKYQLP